MMKTKDQAVMRKMAVEGTIRWMDEVIDSIERDARDLKEYRDRFVGGTATPGDRLATPVSVLGWFMNRFANVGRNARPDLAVNHASALAMTQPEE